MWRFAARGSSSITVQVSEPKTAKGRRSLALDPATVAALRAHRARQAEEKLAVGSRYQDFDLVFTRPDGTAFHPERFSSWFRQLSGRLACRRSGCMMFATATRRPPWRLGCRPRW